MALRVPAWASALALAVVVTGCNPAASAHALGATAPLAHGHQPCPDADLSAVVAQVNALRHRSGLHLLGADAYLAEVARGRSAAMAAAGRLSHTGWEPALRKAGLTDDTLGENVAYNYPTPDAVMHGWLTSPGHRANILRPTFKRIGVGCVIDARGRRWWTQDFAG